MTEETHSITDGVLSHVERFEPVLEEYGYPTIFAANLVEGFGIPMPGQTLLMAGALLGSHLGLNIWTVCAVTWLATMTGNIIGYLIGGWGGQRLLGRFRANSRHLARVEEFYRRHGVLVVIVSRFIDGLRQLTSLVAGSMQMPWWRFFWATAVGATLWVGLWGLGVYFLKEDLHGLVQAFHDVRPYVWVISLLLIGLLIVFLFRRPMRREP